MRGFEMESFILPNPLTPPLPTCKGRGNCALLVEGSLGEGRREGGRQTDRVGCTQEAEEERGGGAQSSESERVYVYFNA